MKGMQNLHHHVFILPPLSFILAFRGNVFGFETFYECAARLCGPFEQRAAHSLYSEDEL
jgi:hypothetical protein